MSQRGHLPFVSGVGLALALALTSATHATAADDASARAEVADALARASRYFHETVADRGGYVYYYSPDLSRRWGEGETEPGRVWVQPPGTPAVGIAYLEAYRATGDRAHLDAARAAGRVLVYGQLASGGWNNSIDCSGLGSGQRFSSGEHREEGFSSLDDGQSQSAIKFLCLLDQALDFRDVEVSGAAGRALDALLAAQFANGGFPQGWRAPAPEKPIIKASYPTYDWRTEGRIKEYWNLYTLNDNVCGYVADTLATAWDVYQNPAYREALDRLGDFLALAQMPPPQPAWAQQYTFDMHPAWARPFEPPAVAGDESQEAVETLLAIAESTGDRRHLAPVPAALDYLRRSLLPDGTLARYYELESNRPLYLRRDRDRHYHLTYDDSDLPSHYGWKSPSRLDEIEARYRQLVAGESAPNPVRPTAAEALTVARALDNTGRWISTYDGQPLVGQPKFAPGETYLSSAVFCENITLLSRFLADIDAG